MKMEEICAFRVAPSQWYQKRYTESLVGCWFLIETAVI